MNNIKVEQNVGYLEAQKLYSVSLRTVEPYGKHQASHIYITAIFHKKRDKAIEMAWKEFYKSKSFQDNEDKFRDEMESKIVTIDGVPNEN